MLITNTDRKEIYNTFNKFGMKSIEYKKLREELGMTNLQMLKEYRIYMSSQETIKEKEKRIAHNSNIVLAQAIKVGHACNYDEVKMTILAHALNYDLEILLNQIRKYIIRQKNIDLYNKYEKAMGGIPEIKINENKSTKPSINMRTLTELNKCKSENEIYELYKTFYKRTSSVTSYIPTFTTNIKEFDYDKKLLLETKLKMYIQICKEYKTNLEMQEKIAIQEEQEKKYDFIKNIRKRFKKAE